MSLFNSCSVFLYCTLQCCSYLVVLVHAEAAHFGLDVFADMFGGRQEATFRLKPQHTQNQLSNSHTAILVISSVSSVFLCDSDIIHKGF